jgi:hypothetical protein
LFIVSGWTGHCSVVVGHLRGYQSAGRSSLRRFTGGLFSDDSQPRAFKLTHGAVSPKGLIAATYVRDGEVTTATVGGAFEPSAAELARREKLKREG